jgi:glycosyltransferase involved in cell wall biosynthesis
MAIDISVLIPTWNRRELLSHTLPTVLQQRFDCGRYEVIVAVDGSHDGAAHFLRELDSPVPLKVLELPHRGRAAALNSALRVAVGRIVLFLDDDLLCDPGLLAAHWDAHASGEKIVVIGAVALARTSPDNAASRLRRDGLVNFFQAVAQSHEPRPLPLGQANSSISRSHLLAVANGFDESFVGASEETDCGFRLWQAGARFVYIPQALSREIYCKNPAQVVLGAAQLARNEWRLCRKYTGYRPYTRLLRVGEGSRLKRMLRRLMVRIPVNLDYGLALLTRGFERLPGRVGLPAAARLLGARAGLAFFRTALKEAGSWEPLANLLSETLPPNLLRLKMEQPLSEPPR